MERIYTEMPTPIVTVEIAQGATLIVPFSVSIDGRPAPLSGAGFKSTLKTDRNLPDDDPTVIKIDWTGVSASGPGTEVWVVPAETTQNMQPVTWSGLIRASSIPGLPYVTDLFESRVIISQPVSNRF
jgi:hypothetical protein